MNVEHDNGSGMAKDSDRLIEFLSEDPPEKFEVYIGRDATLRFTQKLLWPFTALAPRATKIPGRRKRPLLRYVWLAYLFMAYCVFMAINLFDGSSFEVAMAALLAICSLIPVAVAMVMIFGSRNLGTPIVFSSQDRSMVIQITNYKTTAWQTAGFLRGARTTNAQVDQFVEEIIEYLMPRAMLSEVSLCMMLEDEAEGLRVRDVFRRCAQAHADTEYEVALGRLIVEKSWRGSPRKGRAVRRVETSTDTFPPPGKRRTLWYLVFWAKRSQ